jgi:hypothetical protein
MTSTTGQEQQGTLELQQERKAAGPVECLGLTFDNDEARREHFLALLKERLQDPEFRKTPGFPQGSDVAILRMSDPPYYTACPNPFLGDFVRCYGKPYDPDEVYIREPFAVDVSIGKTDQLYRAHGYHTKVPHLAIVPSILHYTDPGDLILDGFCGSGMTGIASHLCSTAPFEYRAEVEAAWEKDGRTKPEWGLRRSVLNDLGPAATFITANYILPFDVDAFRIAAEKILDEVDAELGWMYETSHLSGKDKGRINFTVWSEVFTCPHCTSEVVFADAALDQETKSFQQDFVCPSCQARVSKNTLERVFDNFIDKATGEHWKRIRLKPILLDYNVRGVRFDKKPDTEDILLLERIAQLPLPANLPTREFPKHDLSNGRCRSSGGCCHSAGLSEKGFTNVHHLFLPRSSHLMAAIWQRASSVEDHRLRNMLLWYAEQAIWGISLLNRYKDKQFGRTGGSQVNNYMTGIYYISSVIGECSPWYILHDKSKKSSKLTRLVKSFKSSPFSPAGSMVQTGDCAAASVPEKCIDYIFTDPPFGENINYADLNFLVESWHGVTTSPAKEAIVDLGKKKRVHEYQGLMRRCFQEYHRVLKPGRWMTVVFSNSSNAIWRAIQEAMGSAGFVIADVRTLDKKQGSYRQVTSSAVKQDLVISAYKPTEALENRFVIGQSAPEDAWAFVREHLRNVPVFVGRSNEVELVVERSAQMLLDRMIAFHVQHGISVPLSGPEFLQGLAQRFPERDGMYFLPDQVTEYDRKRTTATQLRQLSFFVNDEHSAIQWIRQQLQDKPQTFQDLQPQFMRELQAWAKHEQTVELKVILEQNFLHYDSRGSVPSQIHSYLSTNFKDLRNLDKEDSKLIEKARDRWYVPDPNKQADLDQIRERALLKEFEEIKESTQRRLKQFRTEAVRAGFKACWQERDYATIVKVAAKLPEAVLQEDEKLLMYIDNAQTRLGDDA